MHLKNFRKQSISEIEAIKKTLMIIIYYIAVEGVPFFKKNVNNKKKPDNLLLLLQKERHANFTLLFKFTIYALFLFL